MKIYKLKSVNTNYNPLDLIEDIIIANNWEYERDSNNNIHVEVAGEWCDYQLSYGINEDYSLLYISCVFLYFISLKCSASGRGSLDSVIFS